MPGHAGTHAATTAHTGPSNRLTKTQAMLPPPVTTASQRTTAALSVPNGVPVSAAASSIKDHTGPLQTLPSGGDSTYYTAAPQQHLAGSKPNGAGRASHTPTAASSTSPKGLQTRPTAITHPVDGTIAATTAENDPATATTPASNSSTASTTATDVTTTSSTAVDPAASSSAAAASAGKTTHQKEPRDETLLKYDPHTNIKTIIEKYTTTKSDMEENISILPKKVTDVEKDTEKTPLPDDLMAFKTTEEQKPTVDTLSDEELERELAALEDEGAVSLDEDDAAVYLQELGINFGLSARSSRGGSGRSRVASRTKLTSAFNRAVRSPRCASSSGWSVTSATQRRVSTRALVESSLQLTRRDDGAHMYRLLSAKRNHIQELSNDAVCLQKKIKELQEKNRLLVQVCKRQEAALRKFQDAKAQLPHLLEAHRMEITVLQDRVRKLTEAHRRDTSKLRLQEERLLKSGEETYKLRELTKKRNLPERDELNKKLTATHCALTERQQEVDDLRRRLALVEKSSRQQVTAEEGRHRATTRRLQALRRDHRTLQKTLQDRDKELAALQQYRGRALSGLASRNNRGSTSNLSSSTTGFSSMHVSSASSRSTSLSAHPGNRTHRVHDGQSDETIAVRSDVESQSRPVRRTKSGRVLPPISGDSKRGRTRSTPVEGGSQPNVQVSQEWQGPWWSRSHEEDSHTYMVLSSPDLLSSTSPLSSHEQQSPTRITRSAAHTVNLRTTADQQNQVEYSYSGYHHLDRAQMPSNTLQQTQGPVRKFTYTREEDSRASAKESVGTNTSEDFGQEEVSESGPSYVIVPYESVEPESEDRSGTCLLERNQNLYSESSFSQCAFEQNTQTICKQTVEVAVDAPCPVELLMLQSEEVDDTHFVEAQSAVKVIHTTTVTSAVTEETVENTAVTTQKSHCMYDFLTDDTESSVNPSPDLEHAVTLESISDDQRDENEGLEKESIQETDADRKDSNTSNVTNVSSVTTASNVSSTSNVSNMTESSLTSTEGATAANVRRRLSKDDQFSLIENYPPKERRKLHKEIEGGAGSDSSGSGPSPPPVRAPPSAARYRPPPSAKLSRQNSRSGLGEVRHHQHTVSLTHLDDNRKASAPTRSRTAITP